MTFPLLAGDEIPAQVWTNYTPVLQATTTDPTLGSGSLQSGRYIRDPLTGLVTVQARISFGTSSVNAGSGDYRISLPTAASGHSNQGTTGISDIIGTWTARDASSVGSSRHGIAALVSTNGGPGGVGLAGLFVLDGSTAILTHNSPIAWAASDGIVLMAIYRGA